uniref:WHY3 n=1 Tax=Arundo donax TaxID=35708 RepID=A0A0A9B6K4_ARUDO
MCVITHHFISHLRHSYSGVDCGLLYGRDSSGLIELVNVLQPMRCGMM